MNKPKTRPTPQSILRDYNRGIPVREIAARAGRSPAWVYAVLSKQRPAAGGRPGKARKGKHASDLKKVNIYRFADPAAFMRAWFKANGRKYGRVSYRVMARRLGLAGASYLAEVVNGHTRPSERMIRELPEQFGLSGEEARYFAVMCYLARSGMDEGLRRDVLRKFRG